MTKAYPLYSLFYYSLHLSLFLDVFPSLPASFLPCYPPSNLLCCFLMYFAFIVTMNNFYF